MAQGVRYDPAVKAAVIGALLAGQGVAQTAREYKVPAETVKTWRRQAQEKQRAAGAPVATASQEEGKRSYDELLDRLLRESIETRVQIEIFCREPKWLIRQSAADIAVLQGVGLDKIIRVLEAAERAGNGPSAEPEQTL